MPEYCEMTEGVSQGIVQGTTLAFTEPTVFFIVNGDIFSKFHEDKHKGQTNKMYIYLQLGNRIKYLLIT